MTTLHEIKLGVMSPLFSEDGITPEFDWWSTVRINTRSHIEQPEDGQYHVRCYRGLDCDKLGSFSSLAEAIQVAEDFADKWVGDEDSSRCREYGTDRDGVRDAHKYL